MEADDDEVLITLTYYTDYGCRVETKTYRPKLIKPVSQDALLQTNIEDNLSS